VDDYDDDRCVRRGERRGRRLDVESMA